jgi:hypothetical protein
MDPRTMPLVVFRCPICGAQEAVRLTGHIRYATWEWMTPHPSCDLNHPTTKKVFIQIDYAH